MSKGTPDNGGTPKRKAGRPRGTSRIETNDQFREILLEELTINESKSAACAVAGCTYESLRGWLKRARAATEGFWADFFVAYTQSRAPFWQAWTERLSKRSPEIMLSNECGDEWHTARKVEVTVKEDPFGILREDEVTRALDRAIARRAQGDPLALARCSRS